MEMKVDDNVLRKVFKALWSEFKVSAGQKKFLIFPTEKIEILSSGVVCFDGKDGARDLRDGLRQLGVTMYQLATGYSERNKASLAMDGYPAIETELWPAIALMLSGQAFSIPQIDEMIGWKTSLKKKGDSVKRKTADFMKNIFDFTLRTGKIIWSFLGKKYKVIKVAGAIGLGVLSVVELIFVFFLNISFSSVMASLAFAIVFGIALLVVYSATFGSVSNSNERTNRQIMNVWFFPSMFVTMMLYAGTAFIFILNGGAVADNANSVIVERSTGKFVGRVPTEENKTYLVFESIFLNHFKYKIIPGLPINGTIDKNIELVSGEEKLNRILRANYTVVNGKYPYLIEKYGSRESLEAEIVRGVDGKLIPATRKHFDEYVKKLKLLKSKTIAIDINVSGDVAKDGKVAVADYVKDIEEDVRNKMMAANMAEFVKDSRSEIRNVQVEGVVLSLSFMPPEVASK